jgi:hypothetical protein
MNRPQLEYRGAAPWPRPLSMLVNSAAESSGPSTRSAPDVAFSKSHRESGEKSPSDPYNSRAENFGLETSGRRT